MTLMQTDADCLQAFAKTGDPDAFRVLVERYMPNVYAAARRQLHDPTQAEDAAQAVFIILARKAKTVRAQTLAGWLVKTSYHTALASQRSERRRAKREQTVAREAQMISHSQNRSDENEPLDDIAPLLDQAMARLSERDRTALTLRFFQGQSLDEVALSTGITPSAAAKRIERAVAKLRRHFAVGGFTITGVALASALSAKSAQACPSGLIESVSTHALLASKGAAATSAPALLAKGVMIMTATKKIGVAALILLALLGTSAIAIKCMLPPANHPAVMVQLDQPTEAPADAAAAATPVVPPSPKPIRVGIYLSYYTATGPHWTGSPYGWTQQTSAIRMLRDRSIDLIPVLEPGTAQSDPLPGLLHSYFPGKTPLDASSKDDLRSLNVLVAIGTADIPDNVLPVIDDAVKNGTGLLKGWFGFATPGYTPMIDELCGLAGANYQYSNQTMECVVASDSPLLGDLSGQMNKTIRVMPNGEAGTLTGTPLLKLKNPADLGTYPPGAGFYPLYTSQLGQGRIVGIEFAQYRPLPPALDAANHGRFYIHCIQWLANQPVQ